jgi:hypothetical protein
MAVLPHPWDTYARLQRQLRRNKCVGDCAWGTEAGLNFISMSIEPPANDDIRRVISNERRRERYRGALRRRCLAPNDLSIGAESVVELALIKTRISLRDWQLLFAIAGGQSYDELASIAGTTAGSLRVRVARLRSRLFRPANE